MTEKENFETFLADSNFPLYIRVRILPSTVKTEIVELREESETWKIRVAASPQKGKANAEHIHLVFALR